jgi:hypothetical protein
MCVDVDETGAHDATGRVDGLPDGFSHAANRGDAAVLDADVTGKGRRARAVDDAAGFDQQLEHGRSYMDAARLGK